MTVKFNPMQCFLLTYSMDGDPVCTEPPGGPGDLSTMHYGHLRLIVLNMLSFQCAHSLCLESESHHSSCQRSSCTGSCEVITASSIQACGGLCACGGRKDIIL